MTSALPERAERERLLHGSFEAVGGFQGGEAREGLGSAEQQDVCRGNGLRMPCVSVLATSAGRCWQLEALLPAGALQMGG
jgi:hypothetical protein